MLPVPDRAGIAGFERGLISGANQGRTEKQHKKEGSALADPEETVKTLVSLNQHAGIGTRKSRGAPDIRCAQ